MTETCKLAANYIIKKTNKFNSGQKFADQILITCKRLQKLLYFSDIEFMKRNNGNSMYTEEYYAWPSGPVIPSVYYEFLQYQNGEVCPLKDGSDNMLTLEMVDAIDYVLNQTNGIDTVELIAFSHIAGGPWSRFYTDNDPNHEQLIQKSIIYSFYMNRNIF